MNTTDTPRTVAARRVNTLDPALPKYVVAADEMEKIKRELADCKIALAMLGDKHERELAEAKAEIERLDWSGIHSCHHNCQRPMCKLRRELAEAIGQKTAFQQETIALSNELADWKHIAKAAERERDNAMQDKAQADTDTIRALHERNEARQQSDRLMDAINKALNTMSDSSYGDRAVTGRARTILTEALNFSP